jgi:hypothetical protein
LFEVGQTRVERRGVEEEDMGLKSDAMPSLSSFDAQRCFMRRKGAKIEGFFQWQKNALSFKGGVF